ncbi:hypothetical protein EGW08_011658 [Elysia chlorotica]|uniref:ubiquitinyl hydrolase 1 n=1 Tax=Elysia chlorotica TaxID=188477 RepID=A0A3S1B5T3_ELYCH|nr:hypothetical protein EGW08_011658 [Elysia chlorotica]
MEVTSSSQAATSPSTHHGPLGSSNAPPHSANDEAAGGEEDGDGLFQEGSSSQGPYGSIGSSSRGHHHHHSLDVAPLGSLITSVVSPSPGAEGDNLNNAVDFGGTGMELVRYGPAYPPFYSSENMNYSKDIRDSKAVHGSCGLYNLGNTCFMNSGLQSLMSCAPLVKFFCESYRLTDGNRHTLTAQFYLLLCKMWSGQFSVVHPRKFKDFLGMYHSQFEDYRQHDCQEFLALLLDTLHEQLNKATCGLFSGSPRVVSPALVEMESNTRGNDQACSSNTTLNNQDQMEEEKLRGTNVEEALVVSEIADSSQTGKESSGGSSVACCAMVMSSCTSVPSPVLPLGEGSPASEVSLLESVVTSPVSLAESTSSSKSPERSVVPSVGDRVDEVHIEEEEEISSSRSTTDDVTSSDCGELVVKPSLKRVSSGSSMSAGCGQLVLHSEDSNHSSLSAHSTDSEQSSAFKRLKIEPSAEMGRNSSSNNSSHLREYVTSTSECTGQKLSGLVRDRKPLLLSDSGVCAGNHSIRGKTQSGACGVSQGTGVFLVHDHSVIDNMVSSCQDHSICSSASAQGDQSATRGADSAAGAIQQPMSPLQLSCLDDFYSKETKTLNTNVQVSEFPQEITADSEKFAKVDNRNRPPSKEVNILQEALGEENKTEKVLIGESLGSGIKENNLYAQSSNTSMVKPPKNVDLNVLHNLLEEEGAPLAEETSKLSCVAFQARDANNVDKESAALLKPGEATALAGVTSTVSGFKFDENEKNVQMQAYSKFNTTPVRSNIRVDLSNTLADTDSMEVDEAELLESSDEDDLELVPPSHTSTVEACSSVPNCLRHSCPLSEMKMATQAWEEYCARNDSVVVSTFQGQFRSTVVCSECSHVSVTYEPFMYLSLPIPHAMDQQICVTYISEHKPPVKYLLNLLKTDKVIAAKQHLNRLLGKDVDDDIVMAEVLDSHISRILDNNVLLKYVNIFNRKIYAFEIVTYTPSTIEISTSSPDSHAERESSSPASLLYQHKAPLSRLGRGGVTPDCTETSNQSFDSVIVNSPGSRDALDGMLSDSEGCEGDMMSFSSSPQVERRPEASVAAFPVVARENGDESSEQCLPTSSAENLRRDSWFVSASRPPCSYDESCDDVGDTFVGEPCENNFTVTHGSSSNKISSSFKRQSSAKSASYASSPPSKFWIDEHDHHATEKMRTLRDNEGDEDNEADAGQTEDKTTLDPDVGYALKGNKNDARDSYRKVCYSQSQGSPSSPIRSSTSTVSSSSTNNHHHHHHHHHHELYRDQVSSSQAAGGARAGSPVHSPSLGLDVCLSSAHSYTDTGASRSRSGSGHLSRSCPSPKLFSEMSGQGEEATLLGAAAKLGEKPGSYFLQSQTMGNYDDGDFYSDQEGESSDKIMSLTSVRPSGQGKTERDCEDSDWSNTFPVHNFTAPDLQHDSASNQWKSCAICLEDLLDSELLTHVMCDGVFCSNCLEMSVKHTADVSAFSCPICLHPADMCEDFVPLATVSGSRPKVRTVQICLAFRHSVRDNTGATLLQLFGHPNIVHVPSVTRAPPCTVCWTG